MYAWSTIVPSGRLTWVKSPPTKIRSPTWACARTRPSTVTGRSRRASSGTSSPWFTAAWASFAKLETIAVIPPRASSKASIGKTVVRCRGVRLMGCLQNGGVPKKYRNEKGSSIGPLGRFISKVAKNGLLGLRHRFPYCLGAPEPGDCSPYPNGSPQQPHNLGGYDECLGSALSIRRQTRLPSY